MTARVFIFLLSFLPLVLSGQNALLDSLAALKIMVTDVQIGTDEYRQVLEYSVEEPYRITHIITEIDNKGREEELQFAINLGLLEEKLVRYEDGKDQIRVNLRSGKDPVVKILEDGELKGYDDEAYLLSFNVDNAREMERIIRNIIPLAKAKWEADNALPQKFEELSQWVKERIGDVMVEEDRLEQEWKDTGDDPCQILLEVQDEKGTQYQYFWSLDDILPPSIGVEVKGKTVEVELGIANRSRYIQVLENGEMANYESSLRIAFSEVDDAQIMAHALRDLVDLAKEKAKANRPVYANAEDVLAALQATIPSYKQDEDEIEQSLTGDCLATFELGIEDGKSASSETFVFDFADLQAKNVEIKVKGKNIIVAAGTANSHDFIYVSEDGEQQNYEDELIVWSPNLPTAKLLRYQIEQLAEQCSDEVGTESYDWIEKQLTSISESNPDLRQELELLDSDDCKWAFTQYLTKGKSIDEERYEFNLYDLDSKRVELTVKGKIVSVEVPTLRNEEIIKNFSDGEELGYTKELQFFVNDVASGKMLAESLRGMIGKCVAIQK